MKKNPKRILKEDIELIINPFMEATVHPPLIGYIFKML